METDASNIPLPTNEDLSPTEQDLLDEYERLAENMKTVCFSSSSLFALYPLSSSFPLPRFYNMVHKAHQCPKQLAHTLETMSNNPTAYILDNLRQLERKTSLVFTLLKASVYSIVLQQQISEERNDDGAGEGSEEGDYE
ncbi:putative major facilitator superfamily transporter protein [Botrytis fragariae]|uniref:DASH complex subunit DAD3 n=1 Tax=Botrytis fragariae TaxID=1964551 RepID=A0A8H6EFB0_9HELO|nr:putative major facilitator superfamily transporter protein [Botrytis fragariae]KAF5870254.1 putative major facilitator superfamily transporter protein [Botrytis fragariae]